jgi:LacI family transcriptional regulator
LVPPEWLEMLSERVPLVMVGRHDEAVGYDTVAGDDVCGAREVLTHLLSLGHRRIVHLTEAESVTVEGSGTPHAVRLQTYRDCMRAAGLEQETQVVHVTDEGTGARDATLAMLRQPRRPTAIFAGHDALAIGALAAVAEAGLTAREISIAGYDNTRFAGHPLLSLTSVDQGGGALGRQAVAMLLERIHGREEPRRQTITPRLVARGSTTVALPDEA